MLPLSSGIFLANTINNFGKRHPKLNTLLIDSNLAVYFIPNMISGLVAGIHFKYKQLFLFILPNFKRLCSPIIHDNFHHILIVYSHNEYLDEIQIT